jgi:hypothetical protein
MGKGGSTGLARPAFVGWLFVIAALVAAQSIVHLMAALELHRTETWVDLDRSNGLPDIVSTLALVVGAVGAGAIAFGERGPRRIAAGLLAVIISALMLADALHDGAHPSSATGRYVIGLVVCAAVLLGVAALSAAPRTRLTLAVAVLALGASFLVAGLGRLDHRFERGRPSPIAEYQIVAKEGFELLGWSLVALVLWDVALLDGAVTRARATAPASRAWAAPRRRGA